MPGAKEGGKTVGLITGCFDILHFGHIQLFRFAKRRVDVLIVGVDSDDSVKLSKGEDRPLFSQKIRAEMLAEQKSVDYVFVIEKVFKFTNSMASLILGEITKKLGPTHLIIRVLHFCHSDPPVGGEESSKA